MKSANLQRTLRELGRRGRWCISEATLRMFLPEPVNTFRLAMTRHVRERVLDRVAPGLYLNPYAQPPAWALERLATHLRPDDVMYVSLESALHEHGWISQVPSRLTIMTSGRSYTYKTPLGTIEFVQTVTKPAQWRAWTTFMTDRRIHVASPELAFKDLRRLRRNLDLVDPAMVQSAA